MPAASYLTGHGFTDTGAQFAATSTFYPLGAQTVGGTSTTESVVNWITRTPGIWSNLQCYITANASSSVVIRFRKNSGNGNQLLSIGATTNTYFQDTSNTDVVAAADTVNLGYTAADTNGVSMSVGACQFRASSGYATRVGTLRSTGQSYTAAATDNLNSFCAVQQTGNTDDSSKTVVEIASTVKNLYANVSTNARTTTTNMRLWKNNAAGNCVVPYTSGQTGIKEDTSNTDVLAATDTVQFSVSTAAADTASIVVFNVFADVTSTTSALPYAVTVQATILANATVYVPIIGRRNAVITTEAQVQLKAGVPGTLNKSSIVITANTVTATSNFRVRVNGNPGNNVRAVGSGVTGTITDTSNADAVVAADLLDVQCAIGATGTSLAARQLCLTFNATVTSPLYYYLNQLLTMGAAA